MDNREKLEAMDKILRELEDLKNSGTAVLKKVAQVEAENINLGIGLLDQRLPDIHDFIDKSVDATDALITDFTEERDKFVRDNKLDQEEAPGE
ncbi:hypothetical protein [Niabella terrae]